VSEPRSLRIGTRGSALALAQATLVGQALAEHGIAHEVVVLETAGDQRRPDTAWGEGAFVTAIERALVEVRIDIAVHSAKDVPTDEDPRLAIAAFLPREESRDALVLPMGRTETLDTLPPGTIVGTDSPRRTGFLRACRADLDVQPLHGNVDSRLGRLDDGAVGALVLAAAGLIRLGQAHRITPLLPLEVVPPAPGQGAIAVQVRATDDDAREIVAEIDHAPTRVAVEAERAFLNATGGGCRAPIGAWSAVEGERIELHGGFASLDGRATGLEVVAGSIEQREALAEQLARRVVLGRAQMPAMPRVLVTRPDGDSTQLVARLAEYGIAAPVVPAIAIELLDASPELGDALDRVEVFDWVVVTSVNAGRAIARGRRTLEPDHGCTRWAAVGTASARKLVALGVRDVWTPSTPNARTLARELPLAANARVLWIHGDLAEPELSDILTERGARLTKVLAYRTKVGPDSSRPRLAATLSEAPLNGVILASPSAARGLVCVAKDTHLTDVLAIPAVCVGEKTASAAREVGFAVAAVARTQDPAELAEIAAEAVGRSGAVSVAGDVT
jgi:hydroxymethylbilane synthase